MRKTLIIIGSWLFILIACVCGLAVIGSVGAIEQDMVSITQGIVQAVIFGALTLVFGKIGFALFEAI